MKVSFSETKAVCSLQLNIGHLTSSKFKGIDEFVISTAKDVFLASLFLIVKRLQ